MVIKKSREESQIDQYRKLRKRRGRLLTILIILLLALAITIGAVSFYGDHVGDFVIMVERDTAMSLALCEERGFRSPQSILSPKGVKGQTNTSFFQLPLGLMEQPEEMAVDSSGNEYMIYPFATAPGGDHSDRQFNSHFAYTFYLKNTSRAYTHVDYTVTITLRQTFLNVDEALRVMVIRNRDVYGTNGNRWIFAKRDRDAEGNRIAGSQHITQTVKQDEWYASTPFEDNDYAQETVAGAVIGTINIKGLTYEEIDDYTVVMWLEGDDPDCTNAIKGGKVMLDMNFAIVG